MKRLYILILCLCSLQFANAQNSIEGNVRDTMAVKNVPFASVTVINQSDSALVNFTRTDVKGKFKVEDVPAGKYILLLAHAKYVDYVEKFEKTDDGAMKMGQFNLFQRGRYLKEVIIRSKEAVQMRGDTLEYLADSFSVRKGAVVEDLLKVLPGMQVDKDGKITVMGETVQKVLVDGEEFFGDDPTVATQNLQSKVVEKVQVFDLKSEQAEFTGFDDGDEQKAINLKLKANMNKGLFGKAEVGAGWEDRWNNQVMANSFRGKRQISFYGIMNSIGQTGLGWQDNMQYGSGSSGRMFGRGGDDDGAVITTYFTDEDDDDLGGNWGRNGSKPGINKTWTGGARYANKLDDKKHEVSVNYSYGRLNRELDRRDYTETILPTRTIFQDDTSSSFRSRNIHKLNGRYKWNIDSSTAIIYKFDSRLQFKESISNLISLNKAVDEVPISRNTRGRTDSTNLTRVTNDVTLNRKLGKKGRTVSLNAIHTYNRKTGLGTLNSTNLLDIGGSNTLLPADQHKDYNSLANSLLGSISYTEPIGKNVLLRIGYGISYDNSDLSTLTTDTLGFGEGNYQNQIDSLSSQFDMNILRNSGVFEIKYKKKKINLTVGTSVSLAQFDQYDRINDINYDYDRINLFPSLRLRYKFSQFKRIDVNYSGSTTNPSPQQLQPIQNNDNPLSVFVGNPNLQIGYRQNLRINYFSFQALSGKGMWAGAMVSNSLNPVGISRTFDAQGRTVNTYENLSYNVSASSWAGLMTKLGDDGWETRLNLSASWNTNPTIVNSVESRTNTYGVTISPNISFNDEEKGFISFDPSVAYSVSQNRVGVTRDISYWSFVPTFEAGVYLPKDIEIGTSIDYTFRPAVSPYPDNFSRFVWDAYASKRVLESKNLELRFGMWDILNQNIGYDRVTNNNYNTESFYNTLGRYWMASANWNFFSGPMAKERAEGGRHGGRRYRHRGRH